MKEIDTGKGWTDIPGTTGLQAQLLSGDFNEATGTGFRTRFVRFAPGGETFEPFSHTYWEEVYLAEGEITSTEDGETLRAPAYVIRPPGTSHGPFRSETGCLMLEMQYFGTRRVGLADFLDPKAPSGNE